MWRRNKVKDNNRKAEHDKFKLKQQMDTLVGPNTNIKGDISFKGGLHVEGTIIGKINCDPEVASLLVVGNSARIVGDIKVQRAVINGCISGNLYVFDHLELGEKAVILGDVHYNLIEMAVGSEVRGQLIPDGKKEPNSLLEDHSKRVKNESKHAETVD